MKMQIIYKYMNDTLSIDITFTTDVVCSDEYNDFLSLSKMEEKCIVSNDTLYIYNDSIAFIFIAEDKYGKNMDSLYNHFSLSRADVDKVVYPIQKSIWVLIRKATK